MNRSTPGLPVHHQLPEFIQTQVHRVGDAIQLSHPLLSSPSPPAPQSLPESGSFPESTLRMRWPKYWSFSFNINPSNEHPGLILFRMDWLDLLAVQGTLKSLLQCQRMFDGRIPTCCLSWVLCPSSSGTACCSQGLRSLCYSLVPFGSFYIFCAFGEIPPFFHSVPPFFSRVQWAYSWPVVWTLINCWSLLHWVIFLSFFHGFDHVMSCLWGALWFWRYSTCRQHTSVCNASENGLLCAVKWTEHWRWPASRQPANSHVLRCSQRLVLHCATWQPVLVLMWLEITNFMPIIPGRREILGGSSGCISRPARCSPWCYLPWVCPKRVNLKKCFSVLPWFSQPPPVIERAEGRLTYWLRHCGPVRPVPPPCTWHISPSARTPCLL